MRQALPAIILAALRRFPGPALFRGLRPCPSPGASFWPSGLTLRSSGPAFCGPLTLAVSPLETHLIQVMLFQPAFSFSSVIRRWVCRVVGLRLLSFRQFQVFFASSACQSSASSYHFASVASPPWRSAFSQLACVVKVGFPVLASVSNSALKRTRILRAAYLVR